LESGDKSSQDASESARDSEYWEYRFNSGDTPWELGVPSKVLFEGLSIVFQGEKPLAGLTVLSPGCGTGSDALALADAGATVVAVDWSSHACARLQARLSAGHVGAGAGVVRVIQGDFFALPPEPVDLVCEHTFFCAIDPQARKSYVSTVVRWLKPGGYLVGNFFVLEAELARGLPGLSLTREGAGPPFATTVDELHELLSGAFTIIALRPARQGEEGRKPGMEWVGVFQKR
jgi:SAM-dependent methyltransferase